MAYEHSDHDDQDQAEVYDEDMVDGDNPALESSTFEDIPDVYDATQALGDASDLAELDEADFDEDLIDDEDLEEEDEITASDAYEETDEEDLADPDSIDRIATRAPDEVELDYRPDVDNRRGARSGAGGFESRGELDEEDLDELGYGEEEEEEEGDAEALAATPARSDALPTSERAPREDHDTPHARPVERPTDAEASHDHLAHHITPGEHRQEALIDEAIDETFPASDPISPKHIT